MDTQIVKHTKGPWAAFNRDGARIFKNWGIQGADGKRVCWLEDAANGDTEVANAHLLAAAPALLEALRSLVEAFDGETDVTDILDMIGGKDSPVRAAIALAEGGAA